MASFEPEGAELEMDVRAVAVIWNDRVDDPGEADEPEVSWSGCSPYEAIGLLTVALGKMKRDYALQPEEEED